MSNSYTIKTSATLAKSEAEWSVTLDDDSHMMQYQVYANTLVAAVVAKLGEYALGLASDGNAIQTGAKKLLKEIEGC